LEDKISKDKIMVFGVLLEDKLEKMEDLEDKIVNWRTLVP
jgi:hypothetical protein